MSSKAASFVKFIVQEGKLEEVVAALKDKAPGYRSLPGVLSLTFAQTGAQEIRSCAVYDSMASLEANGPALKETLASVVPLLAEGGFERAVGEVVAEAGRPLLAPRCEVFEPPSASSVGAAPVLLLVV